MVRSLWVIIQPPLWRATLTPTAKLDLAVANENDSTVIILLGNGDGTFTAAANSPITVGTCQCPLQWATSTLTANRI